MRSYILKVGDKLKPFKLSSGIKHTGKVVKVYDYFCVDVELDNGHIMKEIAMDYLTKEEKFHG